jgi:hypothetical protein
MILSGVGGGGDGNGDALKIGFLLEMSVFEFNNGWIKIKSYESLNSIKK